MPIRYQHNLNPLIAGAAAYIGGHGQGQQAEASFRGQQVIQQQQQRFQAQQQATALISNMASQQLAINARAQLQNEAHTQALDYLDAQGQMAFNQSFVRSTGMNHQQALQAYQQYQAQDMRSLGIDPNAGPTEALANYQPSLSFPEFINQQSMRFQSSQKAQSLAQSGMQEVNPNEDRIKAAEAELANIELEPMFDEDERRAARTTKLSEIQRLQSAPKILRPRSPATYTFQEAQQRGEVFVPPALQNRAVATRNHRTGGWDVRIASDGGAAGEQGQGSDPVMSGYVRLMQQYDAAEQDAMQWEADLQHGPPSRPRPNPPGRRPTFAEYLKSQGIKNYNVKTGAMTMADDESADIAEVQAKAQIDVAKIQQAARADQEKGINEAIKTAYEIAKSKADEAPISFEQVEQDARKLLELKQRMARPQLSYQQTIESIKAQARAGNQKAQQYLVGEGIAWQN